MCTHDTVYTNRLQGFAEARDCRDALPVAAELLPDGPRRPGPLLPAPWQLAVQAVLVTALPAEPGGEVVLDLTRLEMRRGDDRARLTKKGELRLVTSNAETTWIKGANKAALTRVPVENDFELVYGELGVYTTSLGTPCDDM